MKTRAAVAFAAKKPLEIVELDLDGPKAGEVLVEIKATGICHTDAYTLDGFDSEGIFPSILGHEGAGIVREVGPGVTSVKAGDHVIPLYTPECRQCKSCLSGKTNLCTAIRATQGKGLMPDGTSRFDRPGLEGHGVRRRTRPYRRAEDRRLVHERQDPDRSDDHPCSQAGGDQQGIRSDAPRQVDPFGRRVLG